jgi:hypothetical protein
MAWISGEMRSENILSESKKSIHAFSYLCDKKEIASMVKKAWIEYVCLQYG